MKKFLPLILLIFFIILIALSTYNLNKKQGENIATKQETNSISFVKQNIEIDKFKIQNLYNPNDFLTNKSLKKEYKILNFFASWCVTCRAEHEVLMQLQKRNIAEIYGIAFRDIDENTKAFLKTGGNPYSKTFKDNKGELATLLNIKAVPVTVITDRSGRVIAKYEGNLQYFLIDEINKIINQ